LTAGEVQEQGLPPGSYKVSSEGEVVKIAGPDPSGPGSTPDVTAKIRADALGQFNGARMLNQAQTMMANSFNKGPGRTSGLSGLADFLPGAVSESNQNFTRDAESGRGMVVQGLGLTGGSVNSMAEAQMWTGPYTPSKNDWDSTTRRGIDRLAPLRESAARDSISVLGGVPDLDGTLHPIGSPKANEILGSMGLSPDLKASPIQWDAGDQQQSAAAMAGGAGDGEFPIVQGNVQGGVRPPNVWMQESAAPPSTVPTQGSALNAITGNTRTRFQRYPDIEAKVSQAFAAGASLDQLNQILASDPRTARQYIRPTDYAEGFKLRKSGRKGDVTFTVGAQVPLTRREEFSGSPTASAGAGFANMMSLGGVEALAPQQYADQKALNPKAAFAGEVAGAIAGSEGLGWAGRQVTGKVLPKLLGGGGKSRFARQVAQDTAYSAGYGGVANGDPLTGAMYGGVGSTGGQFLGKLGSKMVGGMRSPTAQATRGLGVTMTPGELARASLADSPSIIGARRLLAGGEDMVANTPILNSTVGAARTRAVEQGNTAMFNGRLGLGITGWGDDALEQLAAAKTGAYDDAANGVRIDLNDPKFISQLTRARQSGLAADAARGRGDFRVTTEQGIAPILGSGPNITGRQLQDALRFTQGESRVWNRAANGMNPDPSARGLGTAFQDMNNAFVSAAARQAPQAIPKLKAANAINRHLSVMDDAAGRAVNAEGQLFTPAQVIQSVKSNNTRLGLGTGQRAMARNPSYEVANTLQKVLANRIPPTGVNAAPLLALTGAATAGTGQATDSDTMKNLGLLLLLASPYTKKGGQMLNAGLLARTPGMRAAGDAIGKQSGKVGSGMLPLLQAYQRQFDENQ
jgi:hypothetical protein